MADNVDLQAKRALRAWQERSPALAGFGMVPAVLYGGDGDATALAVPNKIVDFTLHHTGDNALYDIDLGSGGSTARIVDVQRDPVSGRLMHVDFAPVNMRERIEVTVPLHVVRRGPWRRRGWRPAAGRLRGPIESLPGDIPQELTIDVSSLGMGENLTLADVALPEGSP